MKKNKEEKHNEVNEVKYIEKANIIIVGKTGVGKSTLINSIFKEEVVKTGVGKPVTQHIVKIEKREIPFTLYDTKGLELNEEVQNEIMSEIENEIKVCQQKSLEHNHPKYLIHACWYCIDARRARFEEADKEWIERISKVIPVIIVVTKGFPMRTTTAFVNAIKELNVSAKSIIPILAVDYRGIDAMDNKLVIESYGVDELVSSTMEIVQKKTNEFLEKIKKLSIDEKVAYAKKWAVGYIGGTGVIGFSPIPFSDAPLLAASQLSMIIHITKIFDLPVDKAFLTTIVSSVAGISGVSIVGKTVVSNALKFVPGAGTIAGGAISASVAIVLTTSLAMAYINVCKYILEEKKMGNTISNDSIINRMKLEFKNEIKKKKRKEK